ncbi:hypothetical protein PIB30_066680 [Stylosanthes scabra]|uniref:Uncharacterized protein n=1 Tax=Stylosanthes scabra TaxID=79078 RepID=A0ABU6QMA4_9FABA|nr:hypothetical protein [Stylosanthes scabra]
MGHLSKGTTRTGYCPKVDTQNNVPHKNSSTNLNRCIKSEHDLLLPVKTPLELLDHCRRLLLGRPPLLLSQSTSSSPINEAEMRCHCCYSCIVHCRSKGEMHLTRGRRGSHRGRSFSSN